MNKFISLVLVFSYLMGVIGGIGYTIMDKAYVISACIAVVGFLAFEKMTSFFKNLMK